MNKIKKLRTEKGLTRPQLSELTGVSVRTIDDWENERKPPTNVYHIERVARALGVTIYDLIDFDK